MHKHIIILKTAQRHSSNGRLIGNHRSICHFRWPWVTLKGHFSYRTPPLQAQYLKHSIQGLSPMKPIATIVWATTSAAFELKYFTRFIVVM